MGKKPVATLVIKVAWCGLLLTLWLGGCGEENGKGDKDTYAVPYIDVLYPEAGLPSNSGLLMAVTIPPKSIDIRVGGVEGTLHQLDPYSTTYLWKPLREMPQGRVSISIQARDDEGREYPVYAFVPKPDSKSRRFQLPPEIEVVSPDTVPPTLMSSQPPQGATGVAFSPERQFVFSLVFSEPILTVEAKARREPHIELSPLYRGSSLGIEDLRKTMIIITAPPTVSVFSPNTKYTLIVEGVQDYAGNKAEEVRLEFTTASAQE
ncbi:Ig-like domain-containing protein [Candidatus Poribacteria bacterium]|nr:Ig-like domain-containing protein [Candidatus Poribacteria bacterium]